MDLSDTYRTLATSSSGLYKDKSSKFHYFAFPVKTEEEIKAHLADLRKTFYDARHHCFAWVLGKDGENYRANDDGEPNHSAGDPILGQIRSHQLTYILIVVVRYFGGTKLGIGGLIQAYKTSALLAIEANEIIEEHLKSRVKINFPYPQMNEVMKLVKSLDLEILKQEMTLDCEFELQMRQSLLKEVIHSLQSIELLEVLEIKE
ncbi:YigZ family protein [Algoriphagus sp.]|uniref:IMPACT family protein n=1 Tax=Algoriphagus sp. TaxID=1872435 RepID=UPI00260992C3|nr:YigZ family protein [Algoriphagus sp.]